MNIKFLILGLLLTTQVFAEIHDYDKKEAQMVISLAGAVNDAKSIRACLLNLSTEQAPANSAQIVEITNVDGQKNTVVYFKSVSAAGTMQSIEMRIYPGYAMLDAIYLGSISDAKNGLIELAKSFKTESLSVGKCYEF